MSMAVSASGYKLPYGALISVQEGAKVDAGAVVATWDPHTHPIIADRAGVIRYQAFEDGITVKRQVDELTGLANYEIIDEKDRPAAGKDLKPGIFLYAEGAVVTDEPIAHFSLPGSALVSLEDGTNIEGVGCSSYSAGVFEDSGYNWRSATCC